MNQELERVAIDRLRAFVPKDGSPYYLCYSGGKDSDCIRILADLAGVPHTIEHNLTTVDAPETVRYVKSIPGIHINKPQETMWQLIVRKGTPPVRMRRYCCQALKERGGNGRLKVTGVRWSESVNRQKNRALINFHNKPRTVQKEAEKNGAVYGIDAHGGVTLNMDNDGARRTVEHCFRTATTLVNPIIDWEESDVWEFLRHYGCESNPLYSEGFTRIGCVGCPMGGSKKQKEQFLRWPKYKQIYVHAFDRMVERLRAKGRSVDYEWANGESEVTGEDVFTWWIGDNPRQISLDLLEDEEITNEEAQ